LDESINVNPFMASGANGTMIDDFGGDNFDHGPLGFIGGQYVGAIMTNGRPIEFHPTPPGTPKWGLGWKEAVARHYNHTVLLQQHGTSTASRLNYLDLDPTYRDAWGLPLLRMTFDFPENDIQSTHNAGGAIMGDDPKTSVVNRYLQCWDVPNVFSIGASAFPQNGTYNYSMTIGALTYWALDTIKNKYLKAPGPLVHA
jgi:gluconate 2-dehydrogenase alpha chain